MVGLDDGATYIKTHAHPFGFGTKEGLKHAVDHRLGYAGPSIGYPNPKHTGEGARF
jgi:hypothetical protein